MQKSRYISVLDYLRGIAVVAVCLFHFALGTAHYLPDGDPVQAIGAYGYLGVDAFFAISGFVLPYSLYLRSYRLRDCTTFFVRRFKRLEPPYLMSIALVIALHQIAMMVPGFRGQPLDLSWQKLLAHLGYMNSVLKFGWLNPVFWTLAIEFQYYAFVAFIYPLLVHSNSTVRFVSVIGVAVLGFAYPADKALLLHWLPVFALGMIAFQRHVGLMSVKTAVVASAITLAVSTKIAGPAATFVAGSTSLIIVCCAAVEIPRWLAPLRFCGVISYSIYLLHVPIGVRVVHVAERISDATAVRYLGIILAFAVSIAASYVFWLFIERPSQRWAKGPAGSTKQTETATENAASAA